MYRLKKPHINSISDIKDWYCSIICGVKYVVAMTARTLSIISYVEPKPENLFTFSEVLLEVPKLVDEFINTKAFPKISLVYDSLEYGRSLSRCLDTLCNSILTAYKSATMDVKDRLSDEEINKLIARSIYIDVYNLNDVPLIIPREYLEKLRWKNLNGRAEFVSVSYDLNYLNQVNAEIYAKTKEESPIKITYSSVWYKDEGSEFYVNRSMLENSIYGAIKHSIVDGIHYFEPYVYLPKLDGDQLNSIKKFFGLHDLFDEVVLFERVQLMLRYYILKIFLEPLKLHQVDIYQRFKDFDTSFMESLDIQQFYNCVSLKCDSSIRGENIGLKISIEDEVYFKALLHTHEAKKFSKTYASGGRLGLNMLETTGEYLLDDFMKLFKPNLAVFVELLRLIDTYKLRVYVKSSDGEIYNVLRNTELSLLILPERMMRIYPDYYRFARLYWREPDFVERTERYFTEVYPKLNKKGELTQQELSDAVKMSAYIHEYKHIREYKHIHKYKNTHEALMEWNDLFN